MPVPIAKIETRELVGEEVNDILTYRPKWIVRNGNVLLLMIVVLMLAATWLIQYPDVIHSSARLKAVNQPKQVVARTDGKLIKLFVQNGQVVSQSAHLGVLQSTADYNQMMTLLIWVDTAVQQIQSQEMEKVINSSLPMLSSLGEVQSQYQVFQNQLSIAKQTMKTGYYDKKLAAIKQDLKYMSSVTNNISAMQKLHERDRELQQKELEAYERLAQEKVIAPLELNTYQSRLLSKDQQLEQVRSQQTNSNININRKRTEALEIQKQIMDERQHFLSSLLELKSQIEKWMQQFVLVASENGTVWFESLLSQNEQVKSGQPLFYIQPEQSDFYAEVMAGQKGFGKIRKGQTIIIRIDGFPSNEFGHIAADIVYLASIPTRSDSFLIKANLKNGLYTNRGKKLAFSENMVAQAEIITDNRRLFQRFFSNFERLSGN